MAALEMAFASLTPRTMFLVTTFFLRSIHLLRVPDNIKPLRMPYCEININVRTILSKYKLFLLRLGIHLLSVRP